MPYGSTREAHSPNPGLLSTRLTGYLLFFFFGKIPWEKDKLEDQSFFICFFRDWSPFRWEKHKCHWSCTYWSRWGHQAGDSKGDSQESHWVSGLFPVSMKSWGLPAPFRPRWMRCQIWGRRSTVKDHSYLALFSISHPIRQPSPKLLLRSRKMQLFISCPTTGSCYIQENAVSCTCTSGGKMTAEGADRIGNFSTFNTNFTSTDWAPQCTSGSNNKGNEPGGEQVCIHI